MSDSEQFLAGIESASEMITLDSLVASARGSFRLIEPFNAASSVHPEVTSIIESVKEKSMVYYHALDLSVDTARRGYTFCCDAKDLCSSLLDVNISTGDLQAFIADMRSIVKRANEEALQVSELFRSVRRGLYQITQRIPEEVANLQEEKRRAIELKAKAERRKIFWVNTTATATAGAAIVAASVALGVGFPPGLLILPIILPVIGLIGVMGGNNALQKAASRETKSIKCVDAMEQLCKAANDIADIIQHIDQFATWWQEQDTMLQSLSDGIHQLRPTQNNRIRLAGVKDKWGRIERTYLTYVTKIGRLQDLYPSSRLTAAKRGEKCRLVCRDYVHSFYTSDISEILNDTRNHTPYTE